MARNTVHDYAVGLYEATKNASPADLSVILKDFVAYLFKERKLRLSTQIIAEFERYAKKQAGIVSITITSAHALDSATVTAIKKAFGETVEAVEKVNPDLIGGVIIQEENVVLDASVHTQLRNLQAHIS